VTGQGTYPVHFANSARDALGKLAGGVEPTLIAISVGHQHAGTGGLDLLGEIKRRHPELPVLMVTAYSDDDRRRRATGLGTAKVLTKPVDFDLLKLQLRQLRNAAD
jgi:DNA-binding NtrC family response regulator